MDPQQEQQQEQPSQSSQYLQPPPGHRPHRTSSSQPSSHSQYTTPSTPSAPRAPVTAHATAIIADTAVFQGPHPIAIGAGTVIHPRTRIYSFEGPVVIGERCVISEKCVVGAVSSPPPAPAPQTPGSSSPVKEGSGVRELSTRVSHNVILAPLSIVHPGAHLHSAVIVEAHAVVQGRADIGSHSKICAACVVPRNSGIKDWTVIWGSGAGFGQRRKRATTKVGVDGASAGGLLAVGGQRQAELEAKVIEDARLLVLQKERETLVKLIGSGGGGARRK